MKEMLIDVSHWDGNVDFNKWKNKYNLWGVIIKAGGHETKLGRYTDSMFDKHYKAAKAAGLHIGTYYYTVAMDTETARKDAEHYITLIKQYDFDLPHYMDVEDPRQFSELTNRELTNVIKTFCDTLVKQKYYAGIYIQGSSWLNNVVTNELRDYANWIAWWRKSWPTEAGDIGMWQQGTINYSTGTIAYADVGGYTDVDWCCIDYPSRIKAGWTYQKKEADPIEKKKEEEKKESTVADNRLTKFCNLMYTACAVWSLGYDQYQRQNIYNGGECDCSSLVIWALKQAGFDTGTASYTGNMSENLTKRGWVRLAANLANAKPGDILLNDTYHTAAVISGYGWDAKIAQASIDERGRATGGQTGDQSGNETNVKNIYTYSHGWSCILRYQGETTNGANSPSVKADLTVDGIGGPATIRKWQAALGTYQDGVISGQLRGNWEYFPAIQSVTWERTGSQLVKAIQKKVGADPDGYWGPDTSKKIQQFLIKNGFSVGPEGADSYFGTNSVKGLQKSLNAKSNPWK